MKDPMHPQPQLVPSADPVDDQAGLSPLQLSGGVAVALSAAQALGGCNESGTGRSGIGAAGDDGGAEAEGRGDDSGGGESGAETVGSSESGEGPQDDGSGCGFVVTTFPKIVDDNNRTSFTRMDESALLDWLTIGGAAGPLMEAHVPAAIINLLAELSKLRLGYPVTVLEHSLQTATRAFRANASDDLVLAALCHDIGFAFTVEGHAEVSAAILRGYVDEGAYRVIRHHTEFEWAHYGDLIGQPTDQRLRHAAQPWFGDAERFADEWDAASFEPGYDTLPLAEFIPLLTERFGDGSLANDLTAEDCV